MNTSKSQRWSKKAKQNKTRRKNSKKRWIRRVLLKSVAPEEPIPIASVHPTVVGRSDALASVKKEVQHWLNQRCQVKHRCIQRTMFQKRCQAHRSQIFSTGWTGGASEHSISAMKSAEEIGPTASPEAVSDRFNRRPMHRFNRWSLESLQLCQEANCYFSCCEWSEEPMLLHRKFRCLRRKLLTATNG